MPKEWNWGTALLDHGLLFQTTSLFLCERLSETLGGDSPGGPLPPPRLFAQGQLAWTSKDPLPPLPSPRSLGVHLILHLVEPGGAQQTRGQLWLAAACCLSPEQLIWEGIQIFGIHCSTCNLEGPDPKQLQFFDVGVSKGTLGRTSRGKQDALPLAATQGPAVECQHGREATGGACGIGDLWLGFR